MGRGPERIWEGDRTKKEELGKELRTCGMEQAYREITATTKGNQSMLDPGRGKKREKGLKKRRKKFIKVGTVSQNENVQSKTKGGGKE